MIEWIVANPQVVAGVSIFMVIMIMLLVVLGVVALIKYLATPMSR